MVVSFVVVAYNEQNTLPKLLDDLRRQDYPHDKIEILLIDSLSTDDTRRIMQDFADSDHGFRRVLVLTNDTKFLPGGNNVALRHYEGDAFVRVDAHGTIPPEFIRKNVDVLQSGEMVSGGPRPNIIDEATPFKETLLTAEQSMFGSGFASYRHSTEKIYPSSLFCGMYRREVFDKVGPYNERLLRTEDNDMSQRIRAAGFRLCYSPEIISYQHTRNTLKKMLRQKYLNGLWIGRTMGVNPRCFSLFHFVPLIFVLGILFTTVLALCGFPWLGALMWAAYGLLVVGISLMEIIKKPLLTNLLLPILFLLLHVTYGVGTLVGLVDMPFWRRRSR
ncbi:MAG: glycosyltransferase [Clostridia bacterium]|nr:glycosyltransferase [Clostridia bacterium]